jgi:hypothetical protein
MGDGFFIDSPLHEVNGHMAKAYPEVFLLVIAVVPDELSVLAGCACMLIIGLHI